LALIRPVITSTDGRWVEMIRWMPTARDICARRTTDASASLAEVAIKSASSSITMMIYGIISIEPAALLAALALYDPILRTLNCARNS